SSVSARANTTSSRACARPATSAKASTTTGTKPSSPSRRRSGATSSPRRNNQHRQSERFMTRTFKLFSAVIGLGLAAGIASVSAHHSTTMFDHSKTMTITGSVVELRWVNPHVSLSIDGVVKERESEGQQVWVMEMTSPGNLVRAGGWRRNAVKPGDKVEVQFSPLREEDHRGGALKKLTVAATGEVFTANLRAQEMPGLE